MYTVVHPFGYRSKKFIRAHTESSEHAHGMKSEVKMLNFRKQPWDLHGNGHFTTVSQGAIRTSECS